MEKNQDKLSARILMKHHVPFNDFLGLTLNDMHGLIMIPLGEHSPIQLCEDLSDETLDQIPLFRIVEAYLHIIQRDKHIKLTPLGALPKKIMVELYEKKFLLDEFIEKGITKLWREQDCIAIMSARYAAEYAGLVRKANNKIALSKAGEKLLKSNNRTQIFKLFLQAYTGKFSWHNNDAYPYEIIGQFAWAFSVFMLDKFGDRPHKTVFYAEKYFKAFPLLVENYPVFGSSNFNFMHACYGIRTFERFFLWFGFVSVETQGEFFSIEDDTFKRTDLVKQVFNLDGLA